MWPFRKKDKYDDYEFYDDNYYSQEEYYPPPQEEDYLQNNESYSDYGDYHDDYSERNKSPVLRIGFILFLIVYIPILILGMFTTEYMNGKGYVVSSELRAEREYVKVISPLYELLQNMVPAITTLEETAKNSIELQMGLKDLEKAVLNLYENVKKNNAPYSMETYRTFLLELALQEVEYINKKVAYHQDRKEDRIPDMKQLEDEIIYLNEQAESQMEAIQERLKRNTE